MLSTDKIFSQFHNHCLSNEESNNILIPQIVQMSKYIHSLFSESLIDATISIAFGKRVLINGDNTFHNQIQRKDINEIIDVNPVKNTIIYFGPSKPALIAPLLYMLHYAKINVQYIVSLKLKKNKIKQISMKSIPSLSQAETFFDLLKVILKKMQEHSIILINQETLILTGQTQYHLLDLMKEVSENENTGK